MFDPKPKTAKPSTKKPKKESSKGSSSRADEKGSRSHAPADDDLGWSEPKYHKYYGLYYVDRYDHESGTLLRTRRWPSIDLPLRVSEPVTWLCVLTK